MLKAGIFLDIENLTRNGGWGMRFNLVRQMVEAQDTTVLRANAYLAVDVEREKQDTQFRERNEKYRSYMRKSGFHPVLKEVKRYHDSDGNVVTKANADLDLAVDALVQSGPLDYIMIGSGDGDFLRLVRALQNRGKRVDLLSFDNTNWQIAAEVDNHFNGFMVPNLIRHDKELGTLHNVNEDKGYGFITTRTGLRTEDYRDDIFCHISDVRVNGGPISNKAFADLTSRRTILEFDIKETERGWQAVNVVEFAWRDREA